MPVFRQAPDARGIVWPERAWSGGTAWAEGEMPRVATGTDVVVTFGFHCNLACNFCLVEDALDQFEGIRIETFRSWLKAPELFRGVERIILSGGEATLEPALLDYVAVARQVPGVKHVRIQTNATRLANRAYLRQLIDAGVDEFFISVHGHDEATTADITLRKGSFAAIMAGVEAVAAQSDGRLFTNTCIVERNHAHLEQIVELVAPYRPVVASFWNLHLRVDRPDTRLFIASVGAIQPFLLAALDRADALGQPARVKWFPRCLLGRHGDKQDEGQPTTLVEPEFWPAVPRYACLYRDECELARQGCDGLSYAYIHRYGWEEDRLQPVAPARTEAQAAQVQTPQATRELTTSEQQELLALATRLGLPRAAEAAGFQLERGLRADRAARIVVALGDRRTWVELAPRDDGDPAWLRTASFAVRHGSVQGALQDAVGVLLRHWQGPLTEADRGGLRLPWWPSPS